MAKMWNLMQGDTNATWGLYKKEDLQRHIFIENIYFEQYNKIMIKTNKK